MSFLVGLAASVLEWILSKLAGLGITAFENWRQDEAIKATASKDEASNEAATTQTDEANAIQQTIDDTFK